MLEGTVTNTCLGGSQLWVPTEHEKTRVYVREREREGERLSYLLGDILLHLPWPLATEA